MGTYWSQNALDVQKDFVFYYCLLQAYSLLLLMHRMQVSTST